MIEAALETVRPAAEAKGVQLQFQVDSAAGLVSGDANRLQQVVWNLRARVAGFELHLAKPVLPSELVANVANLVMKARHVDTE